MFRLDGRVAVITGAASGIGAATALRFAAAGADLVLATHSADGHDIELVRDGVLAAGRRTVVVEVDVRRRNDVERLADEALRAYGHIDIVLANAAIARRVPTLELSENDWNDLLNVNLSGVWRTFQACLQVMLGTGGGRLLATTSTAGLLEAWEEHAHYTAAKAGLLGLVRTMAAEFAPNGVTVNAVAPGIIETPQTLDAANSLGKEGVAATASRQPVRRVGRPEDIAAAFHYLASEEASFVTGQLFVVDGGRSLFHGR